MSTWAPTHVLTSRPQEAFSVVLTKIVKPAVKNVVQITTCYQVNAVMGKAIKVGDALNTLDLESKLNRMITTYLRVTKKDWEEERQDLLMPDRAFRAAVTRCIESVRALKKVVPEIEALRRKVRRMEDA